MALCDPSFNLPLLALVWAILIGVWVVNYYVLPVGPWNSADNTYKDQWRAALVSVLLYWVIFFIAISVASDAACMAKAREATKLVIGRKTGINRGLQGAIDRARQQNQGRPEVVDN